MKRRNKLSPVHTVFDTEHVLASALGYLYLSRLLVENITLHIPYTYGCVQTLVVEVVVMKSC